MKKIMSKLSYLGIFIGMIAGQSAHASEASIFGYLLGGKISPAVKSCPSSSYPNKSKVICWIDKPFVAKDGSRFGAVQLPNSDSRPQWAVHVMFDAEISASGFLEALKVSTIDGLTDKVEIEKSIASRFSSPKISTIMMRGATSATWDTNEAYIHMLCKDDRWCKVEFRSPSSQIERLKEQAAQKLIESKRPKF